MPALCAQGDSIISRGLYFFDKYGFDGDIPARFRRSEKQLHTPHSRTCAAFHNKRSACPQFVKYDTRGKEK